MTQDANSKDIWPKGCVSELKHKSEANEKLLKVKKKY
jgi:hypothetical protein